MKVDILDVRLAIFLIDISKTIVVLDYITQYNDVLIPRILVSLFLSALTLSFSAITELMHRIQRCRILLIINANGSQFCQLTEPHLRGRGVMAIEWNLNQYSGGLAGNLRGQQVSRLRFEPQQLAVCWWSLYSIPISNNLKNNK